MSVACGKVDREVGRVDGTGDIGHRPFHVLRRIARVVLGQEASLAGHSGEPAPLERQAGIIARKLESHIDLSLYSEKLSAHRIRRPVWVSSVV